MKQLFDFGYRMAEEGTEWSKEPPILVTRDDDDTDTTGP
jgi:hypothetical protein